LTIDAKLSALWENTSQSGAQEKGVRMERNLRMLLLFAAAPVQLRRTKMVNF
jgi:hypothetical protein